MGMQKMKSFDSRSSDLCWRDW